jgi:uncharacterized protein
MNYSKTLGVFLTLFLFNANYSNAQNDSLELTVEGIYDYSIGSYAARLCEKGGDKDWSFVMIIGECEATGIMRSLNDTEFSRPLTYDLFESLLSSSSLKMKHIIITKLEDGTYYGNLVVDDNGKELRLDARPSDCVNIALKTNVSIYANRKVWDDNKEKGIFPE